MDTKFAVALHSMIFISESEENMTSDKLAETLNTNPAYVRRILSALAKADLISSASKSRGCKLLKSSGEISLKDIYDAVEPGVSKLNMNLFQNPDTGIHLGKCEKPVIENLYREMEDAVENILANRTLQDLINGVRQHMDEEKE